MVYWKKQYHPAKKVYYPLAIVKGRPVETEAIAKKLAHASTVTQSDVLAVLLEIAPVMHTYMSNGKSVHIKGLGYFRYTLDSTGVKTLADFDFEKQKKAVRVEFIPERKMLNNGTYTRALVDNGDEKLEWIELGSDAEDETPSGGDGTTDDGNTGNGGGSTSGGGSDTGDGSNDDQGENPLG